MSKPHAFNWANRLTILRLVLVPVFVLLILKYKQQFVLESPYADNYRIFALLVFIVCVSTDALDGFVARFGHMNTKLGTILDPLADKLLLVTSIVILSLQIGDLDRLPLWFFVVIMGRDVILIMGALCVHLLFPQRLVIQPSYLGKLTTVFQMATVIGVISRVPFVRYVWCAAGILTIMSFMEYMYVGGRMANGAGKCDGKE